MRVQDLIDILKKLDPELKVYIADWDDNRSLCVDSHRVELGLG